MGIVRLKNDCYFAEFLWIWLNNLKIVECKNRDCFFSNTFRLPCINQIQKYINNEKNVLQYL